MAKGNVELRVVSDNTDKFLSEYDKAIQRGLTKIGMQAEKYAKQNITEQGAVDTGRLRNSITYVVAGGQTGTASFSGSGTETASYGNGTIGKSGDKAVYIGTNVEYGKYVELGTGSQTESGFGGNPLIKGMRPRPFLRPAATEHKDAYRTLFESEFKD